MCKEVLNEITARLIDVFYEQLPFVLSREELQAFNQPEPVSYGFPYDAAILKIPLGDASFTYEGEDYHYEDFYLRIGVTVGYGLIPYKFVRMRQNVTGKSDEEIHPHADYEGDFCMGAERETMLDTEWMDDLSFVDIYFTARQALSNYNYDDAHVKLPFRREEED